MARVDERMNARRRGTPIAARFWLVLAVLMAVMAGVGAVGLNGMDHVQSGSTALHRQIGEVTKKGDLRFHLIDFRAGVDRYVASRDAAQRRGISRGIERDILRVEELTAPSEQEASATATEIAKARSAIDMWDSGTGNDPAVAGRIGDTLGPVIDAIDAGIEKDLAESDATAAKAKEEFNTTWNIGLAVLVAGGLIGVLMVLWLVRSVVPRTRDYAKFAARVSAGSAAGRLAPTGRDELDDLGRTLDDMVGRHEADRAYQRTQHEFVDAMQLTQSEDEAHQLLKRHVERSVAGSVVVVLNRNNSDDRLEATTPIEPGSPVIEGLDGAGPRSCLAVRFARRHETGGVIDPLLSCEVCGKTAEMATCDPLLVGGEVIGSVLVEHKQPLAEREGDRIKDSVSQAAPVLGNLRNLAIAELRASTDALTGLPNTRAVQDTFKRMVAHAARTEQPLAAVLLDLDHFKQINDTYGHGRGDEVLAATADAMRSAVRTADFVGRYGGEEFLILLPGTSREGAAVAAETIRNAVATVTLPTVDRDITASLGIAMLGDDGFDCDTLLRSADRALYTAKSRGRNRVEIAGAA
jgi:diguanylate cyclase (GGDEF)-like protein